MVIFSPYIRGRVVIKVALISGIYGMYFGNNFARMWHKIVLLMTTINGKKIFIEIFAFRNFRFNGIKTVFIQNDKWLRKTIPAEFHTAYLNSPFFKTNGEFNFVHSFQDFFSLVDRVCYCFLAKSQVQQFLLNFRKFKRCCCKYDILPWKFKIIWEVLPYKVYNINHLSAFYQNLVLILP